MLHDSGARQPCAGLDQGNRVAGPKVSFFKGLIFFRDIATSILSGFSLAI